MNEQYKALCALARELGHQEAIGDVDHKRLHRTHTTRRDTTRVHINRLLAGCTDRELMVATDAWMEGYEGYVADLRRA